MWCPKISSSRSLCKGSILYPAKNEEIYGIVPYQKSFMSGLTLTCGSQVGHMWVTSELVYGSVDQMGQQV